MILTHLKGEALYHRISTESCPISPSSSCCSSAKQQPYSLASLFLLNGGLDSSSSVSEVLGINALKGSVALSLGLSDSISVSFSVLVVVGVVLALCHFS